VTQDDVRAVRERFDARAPSYDDSEMHRGLADAVAAFVELDGVTRVLDVATGTGLVLRALRQRPDAPAGLWLTGVDLSPGMLEVARTHLPDATLLVADARRLPLPDASVDLLTCVTALHLVPDTAVVLEQWDRVLAPGARAVIATFAAFDPARHHREQQPGAPAPYPLRHEPFATPEALARTAGGRFVVRRHARWTDGHEVLLLAELARPSDDTR